MHTFREIENVLKRKKFQFDFQTKIQMSDHPNEIDTIVTFVFENLFLKMCCFFFSHEKSPSIRITDNGNFIHRRAFINIFL